LFSAAPGLIIYDEVHLLPADFPHYRRTRRRLGLTATLIREDGKEGDVFALIDRNAALARVGRTGLYCCGMHGNWCPKMNAKWNTPLPTNVTNLDC